MCSNLALLRRRCWVYERRAQRPVLIPASVRFYGLIQAFLAQLAYFSSMLDAFHRFRRKEVKVSKNVLHKREGNLERSRIFDAGFAGYTEAKAFLVICRRWGFVCTLRFTHVHPPFACGLLIPASAFVINSERERSCLPIRCHRHLKCHLWRSLRRGHAHKLWVSRNQ